MMTSLRSKFFIGLLIVLLLPVFAPAIERQRGIIQRVGDVTCLYHCDDYFLQPDPGWDNVILTGLNLDPFIGLHVEVVGWQVNCGSCSSLSVESLSFLTVTGLTGAPDFSATLPAEPVLFQNYPNPFNPQTSITFQVAAYGPVTLTVYNALGERVATLVEKNMDPGTHEVRWDASGVASGVYHYVLRTGTSSQTKSMLLLR